MNVSATPMPVERANSRSADAAPARATPLPARTIGLLAERMIAAASSSSREAGSGRRIPTCEGSGSASTELARTSSGSSMWVGPGFCACATLNALRTTSGMTRAEFSRTFHFVIGRNIETTSMCWWDSLCIRSRSAWPVSATSGERSSSASATPVVRLVAPGPSVPRQTPGAAGQPPVHVGHVRPALLVADGDEGDRGLVERRVEVERLLAGDPEHVPHALGLEALDEQIRRLALRHDSLSRRNFRTTAVSGNLREPIPPAVEPVSPLSMTRNLSILLAVLAVAICAAAPAEAAKRFTIRGAGFGHGVGMSQYGALGYAEHGWTYRQILGHYYTDTAIGTLNGAADRAGADPVDARHRRRSRARAPPRAAGCRRRRRTRSAAARGGQVQLVTRRGKPIVTASAPLRVTGPGPITVLGASGYLRNNGSYRGALEFRPGSLGGVNVINALDVDDYVRGVIPLEVSATWPAEALKAQAVAARTYALTTNKDGDGFDHYASTSSQVYGGVAAEQATSNAAAAADQGPARDLPGRAGRDLLLLDLRRAHRGRREERPRHRAAAVAPLRRGQVRQRLADATAGARSG